MDTDTETPRPWDAGALARVLEEGVVLQDGDGEVAFVSDAAQALLGGPARFAEAWAWLADCLPRDAEAVPGLDVRLPDAFDGRHVLVTVFPVDEGQGGRVCLLKDLRSVEDLEGDLRLALQMRRHARRLQQAAHDLKAPLNSLALNLELAQQHLRADEVDDAEERLELLAREIGRLDRMVRSALTHSQLPRPSPGRFDLRRLLTEVASLLEAEAETASVHIGVRVPDRTVAVRGVRDHIKQALINLAVNSLEAMSEGGRLDLELSLGDEWAILRIVDTGSGIPEDLREHLFKLHFSTKEAGSGLGLYTARATVRGMGGDMAVESPPDGGCVVTVRLPLAAKETDAEATT